MAGAQYDRDGVPVRVTCVTLKGSPRVKSSVAIELSYGGGAELRLSPPPQKVKAVYFLGPSALPSCTGGGRAWGWGARWVAEHQKGRAE